MKDIILGTAPLNAPRVKEQDYLKQSTNIFSMMNDSKCSPVRRSPVQCSEVKCVLKILCTRTVAGFCFISFPFFPYCISFADFSFLPDAYIQSVEKPRMHRKPGTKSQDATCPWRQPDAATHNPRKMHMAETASRENPLAYHGPATGVTMNDAASPVREPLNGGILGFGEWQVKEKTFVPNRHQQAGGASMASLLSLK